MTEALQTLAVHETQSLFDVLGSTANNEALWMSQIRKQAWKDYSNLPEPPAPQRNLRKIPALELASLKAPASVESKPFAERQADWGELSGSIHLSNAHPLKQDLTETLQSQGVVLMPLAQALTEHSELVTTAFNTAAPARDKDVLLNLACWQNGVFLYVPANVQIELPLYLLQNLQGDSQALFARSLVILDRLASVTIIQDAYSESLSANEHNSLASEVCEWILGDGAQVNLLSLQQWSPQIHGKSFHYAKLARNARFNSLAIESGSQYHFHHIGINLEQAGADTRLLGLMLGQNDQHLRQSSLQNHLAPHTTSHLQYHSVLRDQAYSFYNGMIYVDATAQQTESNQLSKSLLLSDKARADAIPNLEILADDVQSGHGSAIGSIDAEQLFYLQSRGFEHETAENMLVEAFMEEVILQFPQQSLHAAIKSHLALRLLEHDDLEDETTEDAVC